MVTLLDTLLRSLRGMPVGASPAQLERDFAGITWRVRARSPALQRVFNGVVEGSTEALVAIALWGWWFGATTPSLSWVVPVWAAIQVVIVAWAIVWDAGHRVRLASVRITPERVRLGTRRTVPMHQVQTASVASHGRGPLHRATLTVAWDDAGETHTVAIAADGDAAPSLQPLAGQVQAWAVAAREALAGPLRPPRAAPR